MQQTILGILALMIVASFTLNQQRGVARTYNELVDDELEIAASGVAMHVMEIIGNRAFDSRTIPTEVNTKGMPAGSADFTSASAFGKQTGCDLDEPFKDNVQCTDIDDAAMPQGEWQDVPFRLKDGKELPFDVHVDVAYVDPDNMDRPLASGQRSLHKKVVVKVRSKRHVKQNRYKDGFVRLERIFSYDVKRAENRFRERYGPTVAPTNTTPPPTTEPTPPPPPPDPAPTVDPQNDPNARVAICHRRVKKGKITWRNKTVKQKFVAKHIGHGDKMGKC